MPTALVTGITGQDGSYLAELLLSKGYQVVGMVRRSSTVTMERLEHIQDEIIITQGDLHDQSSMVALIEEYKPDEVYNLAAQSFVPTSWSQPLLTAEATGLGVTRILEAIRLVNPQIRFYQASSSEMFGSAHPPQNENTAFEPRSPYAAAKAYAFWMTRNYRDGYNLYACNGILFNHESPRRGETFVTRKITRAVAAIKAGRQKALYLGNLDAKRDWGYAPEYVEAMHLILQQENPNDYVIGTGEAHSVREFLDEAFGYLNMDWHEFVKMDPRYLRPTEVDYLLADTTRSRTLLNWEPRIKFHELVRIMVDADLELIGQACPGEGRRIIQEKFSGWHRWDDQVGSMGR
jgi:GDPmannose 4,6-dehydratase